MRYFEATISINAVTIEELAEPPNKAHFRATVDGVKFIYFMKKHKDNKPHPRTWFERGCNAVHYHAINAGSIIEFDPLEGQYSRPHIPHPRHIGWL
jgi:hypothetical protein